MRPLFQAFTLIAASVLFMMQAQSQLVINEFDPSGPGIDTEEFVELYGSANQDLSGFVLVIFNGSNAQSNLSIDLSGYNLNADGFFLIGGPGLSSADIVIESTNWLQVGQEGIALYDADISSFSEWNTGDG